MASKSKYHRGGIIATIRATGYTTMEQRIEWADEEGAQQIDHRTAKSFTGPASDAAPRRRLQRHQAHAGSSTVLLVEIQWRTPAATLMVNPFGGLEVATAAVGKPLAESIVAKDTD